MIQTVYRDLCDATEDVIAHQVNCQGVMGSGVALAIKKKWPAVFEDYKNALDWYEMCHQSPLGRIWLSLLDNGQYIAHLYGQDKYGRDEQYTDYVALRKCFNELAQFARVNDPAGVVYSVAMPYKIACGRGGADWRVVYSMIEEIFEGINVTLYRMEE